MLGKLLKQEWKATLRILLPLYLILICTTLITGLLAYWDNDFKSVVTILSTVSYGMSLLMIGAGTVILLYFRFYKNLLTEEGYLMFTLPVKTSQLVLAKLITASVLTLLSIAVIALSLLCIVAASGNYPLIKETFHSVLAELSTEIGLSTSAILLEFSLLILISLLMNIVTVYLAIALGQLFSGHRQIGAFASYGVIYLLIQLLSLAVVFILILFKGMDYLEHADNTLILLMLPLMVFVFFACYLGTIKLLREKLNLE